MENANMVMIAKKENKNELQTDRNYIPTCMLSNICDSGF